MSAERLLQEISLQAREKKAHELVELDLRTLVGYTDYFLICHGTSERQVRAIHEGIHEGVKRELGLVPARVEGVEQALWVLMDYLDVVVHIFTPQTREFYRLETLWGEAPASALTEALPATSGR